MSERNNNAISYERLWNINSLHIRDLRYKIYNEYTFQGNNTKLKGLKFVIFLIDFLFFFRSNKNM